MSTNIFEVQVSDDGSEVLIGRWIDGEWDQEDGITGIYSEDADEWNRLTDGALAYWGWAILTRDERGTAATVTR